MILWIQMNCLSLFMTVKVHKSQDINNLRLGDI